MEEVVDEQVRLQLREQALRLIRSHDKQKAIGNAQQERLVVTVEAQWNHIDRGSGGKLMTKEGQ